MQDAIHVPASLYDFKIAHAHLKSLQMILCLTKTAAYLHKGYTFSTDSIHLFIIASSDFSLHIF